MLRAAQTSSASQARRWASIAGMAPLTIALAAAPSRKFSRFLLHPTHNVLMRKRVQIALAVVLVMLAGVIAWQVLRKPEPQREPVYHGKGLRAWLNEYLTTGDSLRAEAAVRQIGANAIPTLLDMLRTKDSPSMNNRIDLWEQSIVGVPYLPHWLRYPAWYKNRAQWQHAEAAGGFLILGADGQQAVPELIGIYEQNIPLRAEGAASQALAYIGPAARTAIPSFSRAATNAAQPVRWSALSALAKFQTETQQVVPILTASLSDPDRNIRALAARSLAGFGTNAQQASLTLVRLLSDPSQPVRATATDALRAIDPEAAAKAGVK